jgi:hypothetical protein
LLAFCGVGFLCHLTKRIPRRARINRLENKTGLALTIQRQWR